MKKKKTETIFTQGGESVHGLVQAEFALRNRLGVAEPVLMDPSNLLASKIDIVLRDGTPVEVKSTSLEELRTMDHPKLEHVAQLGYYVRATQASHGILMYVAREAPGVRRTFRVESNGKYRSILDVSTEYMTTRRDGTNPDKFRNAVDSSLKTFRSNEYYAQQYKRFSDESNLLASRLREMQRKKDWKQTYRQSQNALYEAANLNNSGIQNNFSLQSEWGSPTKRKKNWRGEESESFKKRSHLKDRGTFRKLEQQIREQEKEKGFRRGYVIPQRGYVGSPTRKWKGSSSKRGSDKTISGKELREEHRALRPKERFPEFASEKSKFRDALEVARSKKNVLLQEVKLGHTHLDEALPRLQKIEKVLEESLPGWHNKDAARKKLYGKNVPNPSGERLWLAQKTRLLTEVEPSVQKKNLELPELESHIKKQRKRLEKVEKAIPRATERKDFLEGKKKLLQLELEKAEELKLRIIPKDTPLPEKDGALKNLLEGRNRKLRSRRVAPVPTFFRKGRQGVHKTYLEKGQSLIPASELPIDSPLRGGEKLQRKEYLESIRRAYRKTKGDSKEMAALLSEHPSFLSLHQSPESPIGTQKQTISDFRSKKIEREEAISRLRKEREAIREITDSFVQREKILRDYQLTPDPEVLKQQASEHLEKGVNPFGERYSEKQIPGEIEKLQKEAERRIERKKEKSLYRASPEAERARKMRKEGRKTKLPLPKEPVIKKSPVVSKLQSVFETTPLTFFDIETTFGREGQRPFLLEFAGGHFSKESVEEIRTLQGVEQFYRQAKKGDSFKALELKASVLSAESHRKIHEATSLRELMNEGVLKSEAAEHYRRRAIFLQETGTGNVSALDLVKKESKELFHSTYETRPDGTYVPKAKYQDLQRVDTMDDFLKSQEEILEKIGKFFGDTKETNRRLAGHNIDQFDIPMLQGMEERFYEGERHEASKNAARATEQNKTPILAQKIREGQVIREEISNLRNLHTERTLDTLRGDRAKEFFEKMKKHTSVLEGDGFAALFDRVETPDGRRKTVVALENLSRAAGVSDPTKLAAGQGAHRASFDVFQQNVPAFSFMETFLEASEDTQKKMAGEFSDRYQKMVAGVELQTPNPISDFPSEDIVTKTVGSKTSSLDDALPKTKIGKFFREARTEGRELTKQLSKVNTVFEDSIDYVLGKTPGRAHSTFLRRPAVVFGGLGIATGMLGLVAVGSNFTSTPKRPIRPTTRPLVQEDAQLLNQEESPQKVIQRAGTDFGSGWQGLRKMLQVPALRKPQNLELPSFQKGLSREISEQASPATHLSYTPPSPQQVSRMSAEIPTETLSRELSDKMKRQARFRERANLGTKPYFEGIKNQTGHHRMVN